MNTLYICYFGVREPLVQTQVIPYLRAIARAGIGTHLMTFEPAGPRGCHSAADREAFRGRLAAQGITWHRLRYHRRPSVPATLFDVAVGVAVAARLVRKHDIDVLHARSHVPALMALALKRCMRRKYLFDVRGLMADEYAEAGHWPKGGLRFRVTKRVERTLLREADAVVTLTQSAKEYLFPGRPALGPSAQCPVPGKGAPGTQCPVPGPAAGSAPGTGHRAPIAVIPCCVDLERFGPARAERGRIRRELALGDGPVLVYLGSLGGLYLTEELAAFTAAAREVNPEVKLLALSYGSHGLLEDELACRGVPASVCCIRRAEPAEVPVFLAAADVGLSLYRPGLSRIACSPTKIPEYLAAGLPIISNSGIGDVDALVRSSRVGVVLEELSSEAYRRAFARLQSWLAEDPELAERCRGAAREWFDLERVGGPSYVRLYQELARR